MSTPQEPTRYELRFVATGEVRDADGNLLNQDVTAESTQVVSEQEALAFLEQQNPHR